MADDTNETIDAEKDELAGELKEVLEKSLTKSGRNQKEVFEALGYSTSDATQFLSAKYPKKNLPPHLLPSFCEQVDDDSAIEWQANKRGLTCVSIKQAEAMADSKSMALADENRRLKKRIKAYERKLAEITVMLMGRFQEEDDLDA